jgi:hypothetical protein
MRAHLITVTAAALALAVSGCGTGTAPPASTTARDADGIPPAVSTAWPDPCARIAGCTEIARVDVDGDGIPDRVGITISREAPPPQVAYGEATIGVLVASGSTVNRIDVQSPGVLPGTDSAPQPYVGAYPISRRNGADLVFHTQVGGGNSEQFAVIGWSAGKPSLVIRPPVLNANYPDPAVWYIGSSHGVHEWVTCGDGAAVTMNKLSAPTAEGIPLPGGGIHEENHFAFDGNQWTPTGSENIADNNFSYDFDPHTQTFQCEDRARR